MNMNNNADGQYKILKLVAPILEGKAAMHIVIHYRLYLYSGDHSPGSP